jgi:hypothetical protein
MSTTYVFGAGASLHAGYPLASTMGEGLLDFMLGYPFPPYPGEAQFVIDTFGKSPDIERVITDFQSRTDLLKGARTLEGKAERMRLGNCRGSLATSLREWFREIRTKPAPSYTEFAAKIVQPGDVVITFNYDDSLDRELKLADKWDVSRGYGFPLGSERLPSDVLLLKLHGSMNWLVSLFGGARSGGYQIAGWPPAALGNYPVIHRADLQHLGYADFTGHIFEGGGAFPCLILPGRKKEFFYDTSFGHEFEEFWELLWSQAVEAVKRSEKIVLCGYSLLSVDQRACDLLLREPPKAAHVSVVSGNQSGRIAHDFKTAGFQSVTVFAGGYFEEWVQAQVGNIQSARSI